MNQYIINVWCDRIGVEVEETITPTPENTITSDGLLEDAFDIAEEQHKGQCGNRNNPCDAEAMVYGHSIIEHNVSKPSVCPECEHELSDDATKCPTCSGSDYEGSDRL
jgi:ribosomal protein L40E